MRPWLYLQLRIPYTWRCVSSASVPGHSTRPISSHSSRIGSHRANQSGCAHSSPPPLDSRIGDYPPTRPSPPSYQSTNWVERIKKIDWKLENLKRESVGMRDFDVGFYIWSENATWRNKFIIWANILELIWVFFSRVWRLMVSKIDGAFQFLRICGCSWIIWGSLRKIRGWVQYSFWFRHYLWGKNELDVIIWIVNREKVRFFMC